MPLWLHFGSGKFIVTFYFSSKIYFKKNYNYNANTKSLNLFWPQNLTLNILD